jgi:HopA1 effector protein family
MSVDYRKQLAAAVAALEIIQPTAYRWCGRERKIVTPALAEAMQPNELRSYLVDRLKSELYERFYITGSPKADDNMPWRPPRGDRNAFLELLSDANVGSGARTGGWEVLGDEHNLVILRREELKVWVPPGEILADEWPLVVGTKVRVRLPKELRALSPGFYLALGDDDLDEAESTEPIARIYFDLESSGGSVFIAAVTRLLNDMALAFRTKVLDDPGTYRRCDSGVLYVRRSDLGRLPRVLGQIHAAIAKHLKPATPAFTFFLAPGVASADDPGIPGQSFGMSRCALTAEGLVRAYEQGARTVAARAQVVESCFLERGLRPEAPYLNQAMDNPYGELKAVLGD